MKKYLLHLACFICLTLPLTVVFAKTAVTVQGKIVDSKKDPIAGVTVAELDAEGRTIKATKTDIEGNFVLKVASTSHQLSLSHISHKSIELSIGSRTTFNVTMAAAAKDI